MKIGIIANTSKENVYGVVSEFITKLKDNGFEYILSSDLLDEKAALDVKVRKTDFADNNKLCKRSDIIISIGGDGTMLATAYYAQFYDKPVLGINFGKLGFLTGLNVNQIDTLIDDIKRNRYKVEKRLVIRGGCLGHKVEPLYAINDIVIDKGGWPKMIDLTVTVDDEYVTTFAADGLIIATPTGSTGYSISAGGPIVSPKSDVITLCPISPHSLNVRPLVLPSNQKIVIRADSMHKEVHVNCDGRRVIAVPPPLELCIEKSERPLKLVNTSLTSYFETLRSKLMWGIDIRKNNLKV